MMKRIFSLILAALLCAGMALTVSADTVEFVVDEYGVLSDSERSTLNELAQDIYDITEVGVFFVYTETEALDAYDIDGLRNGIEDYVIMLENDTSWFVFYGGAGQQIDADTEAMLRDVYDEATTYFDGVFDFMVATAECFSYYVETDAWEAEECTVLDDADLLTDSQELALHQKLLSVSQTYNAQIVVVTISSMEGGDVDEFIHFLYDNMGFGYGANHDGVMLFVSMDPREYRILANGFAAEAITDSTIEEIGDEIMSDLSDGNYATAFDTFTDKCVYYLDGHINGFSFDVGTSLMLALAVGLLAGVIVAFVLKGQLQSVHKQDRATVYVKPGSMQVTMNTDRFLHSHVTRTQKESEKSSDSGSSRSSGGGSF